MRSQILSEFRRRKSLKKRILNIIISFHFRHVTNLMFGQEETDEQAETEFLHHTPNLVYDNPIFSTFHEGEANNESIV